MFEHMRFIFRDPQAGEAGGADPLPGESDEAKALEAALLDDGGMVDVDKKDDKAAPAAKAGDNKSTPAAGASKGKDPLPAAGDDPDVEIDSKDDKDQPVKLKVKMSELKSGYLRQDDYTKKTQRLADIERNQQDLITTVEAIRQNPKLAKVFVGLVEGAIKKDGQGKGYYDEAFIDKQLNGLQAVQPEGDDTKKDLQDKNEDIEALLKDVDPDSPVAKALRVTHANNRQLMADMKALKEATGKTATTVDEQVKAQQEREYAKLVDGASKMMSDQLDGMANTEAGGLEFVTPGEKQEWRYKVVAFLKDNPVEYKDEKEFTARLDQVGKAVHKYMVAYREGIIAQKLEGPKLPKKSEQKPITTPEAESLEQELERELEAIDSVNKS